VNSAASIGSDQKEKPIPKLSSATWNAIAAAYANCVVVPPRSAARPTASSNTINKAIHAVVCGTTSDAQVSRTKGRYEPSANLA
jgi:hypothetical protein